MECTENRKFDLNGIPDKLPEEAWAALKAASDEKDLGGFREVSCNALAVIMCSPGFDRKQGLKIYSKAVPQATFVDIEKKMREEDFKIYLIAMVSCRSFLSQKDSTDPWHRRNRLAIAFP